MRLVALILFLFASSVSARAENVAGWEVGSFNLDNGLNGCSMSADYQDGTTFTLAVFPKQLWGIMLTHKGWTMQKDAKFTITVTIDGDQVAEQPGVALSKDTLFVMLDGVAMYQALQHGVRLDLRAGKWTNNFSLRGTRVAMDSVISCLDRLPAQSEQRPQTSENAKPKTEEKSGSNSDFAMVPASDALVVLTNLFSASGLSGHRIAPLEKDSSAVKFILPDGTEGRFVIARGRDTAGADEYALRIKTDLLKNCDGRSTADQQSVPTLDGSIIRKVIFGCITQAQRAMVETVIIRTNEGTLFDLSYYNFIKGDGGPPVRMEDREQLTKAAMKIAKQ